MDPLTPGFAPSPVTAKRTMRTVESRAARTGRQAEEAVHPNSAVAAVGSVNQQIKLTSEEERIQRFEKVSGNAYKVFLLDLAAAFIANPLARVIGKVGGAKARVVTHAILSAPMEALRKTKLNALHELPSHYMAAVKEHAAAAKVESWAKSAGKRAENLLIAGGNLNQSMTRVTAPVMNPVKGTIAKSVGAFEKTGAARAVENGIQKITQWRATSASARQIKQLSLAEAALTKPRVGFFQRIGNLVAGKKPAILAPHADLSEITGHLANARSAKGELAVSYLEKARDALENLSKSKAGDKVFMSRLGMLEKPIRKAGMAASNAHVLSSMEGQKLGGMLKTLTKGVGNKNLVTGLVALGAATAIGAIGLKARKEGREANEAYAGIIADLGGNENSAFLTNIKKAYHQQKKDRVISSTLSAAADGVNVPLMSMTGGGGGHMMAVQFMPMLLPIIVHENKLLNSYALLKKADNGKLPLEPEQRIQLVRELVAAAPDVANHKGKDNLLGMSVAEAFVQEKLSAREIVQLIDNNAKFLAFAQKVADKKQAETAAAAPSELNPAQMKQTDAAVAEAQAIANGSQAHTEMPAHAPLSKAVMGHTIQHQGRVAEQQRAVSA